MKTPTALRSAAVASRDGSRRGKLKTFAGMAAFLFTFATVLPAEVYTYTGMDFGTLTGSAYSASDFVSGTFTLAGPLAASVTGFSATSTPTWTISDGVNTLSDANGATLTSLSFSTDSSANIIGWYFDATNGGSGLEVSSSNTSYDLATDGVSAGASLTGGSWEDTTTPEPGTLGMMLAGSLLLFGTIRWRSGKASGQP